MTTVHSPRERLNTEDAKRLVLEHVGPHNTIEDCLRMAGRTRRCYENWRAADRGFRAEVDYLRAWRAHLYELDPEATADLAQVEEWRREFDARPDPESVTHESPPTRPPLPTGTCHACNREDLLVRGPRGDLRCIRCAAYGQHAHSVVEAP